MLRLLGQCYEIRDRLKGLDCVFDGGTKDWLAPEKAHAEAQALVDAENRRQWSEYLATLPWVDGEFTATVWNAALRAASLYVPYAAAWAEIAVRVRAGKNVGDKWFDRNVSRGYEAVAAETGAAWKPERRECAGSAGEAKMERPQFRNRVLEHVAAGLKGEVDLAWLADRSPIDPLRMTAAGFLEALYEPDERVVVFEKFESQGQWLWSDEAGFASSTVLAAALYERGGMPFEQAGREFDGRGQDGVWYLCNPVSGDWRWMEDVASGDDPHWSRRFHECVTSWRYLVLESDKARAREWVAMAVQLPLRIAAIYTSGGKSVHVLVRVDAKSKAQWDEWRDELKPIVITLGADQGCMSAVRLTRLPGCWRASKGQPQKLLYLNPAPDMTPIASRPALRDALGAWVRVAEGLVSVDETEIDPELAARCALALEFYRKDELAAAVKRRLQTACR